MISPPVLDTKLDMFSPLQEIALGDIFADYSGETYVVDDKNLTAYLQEMGDGLVRSLPPSSLNFRFFISNMPDANAFSISGGRVYVSRELIGFVRSEDELAGLLAHELGHIVTHQTAIDFTKLFKENGITEIVDRKDIEEKFNQILEGHKRITVNADDRQEQADRVALEILALSGYRVDAVAEFYDRMTNNKQREGNWFTDTFGTTGRDTKRYRAMEKTIRQFPEGCAARRVEGDAARFKKWQAAVVAYDGTGRSESLPGLISKHALEPPLQDEVHTLRFSPDGKFLVAQDEATIYVLTREPLAFKFRIEAPQAYPAQFTADSRYLSFYDSELHTEVWNVAEGLRTKVFDVVAYPQCLQTALSPDASTLACVDARNGLTLFTTATGDRLYERKNIRQSESDVNWGLGTLRFSYEIRFVNMGFSLDGRYFLLSDKDVILGIAVDSGKEIPLSGAAKSYVKRGFAFLDGSRLVGNQATGSKGAVISFPDGKIERELEIGASAPFRVTNGDAILLRPIHDYAAGVLDLRRNEIIRASKTPAMDLYGDVAASMLGTGEVGLFGNTAIPIAKVALPLGHFGELRAVDVSDDLNFLAVSTRSRGAVWNLAHGSRLYNVKGFKGACFDKDGSLYVDFPKQEKVDRSIVRLNLQQSSMTLAEKLEGSRVWQDGHYLFRLKAEKEDKIPEDEDKRDYRYEGRHISWREVFERPAENETLEVRSAKDDSVLWEKKFNKAVPVIHTDDANGVVIFRWRMGTNGARAEAKTLPDLKRTKSGDRDEDYLIEIVETASGKPVGSFVIDTKEGAFSLKRMMATPEWFVAEDTRGRTLVYSVKTGARVGAAFGKLLALSPLTGQLVIERGAGRAFLYSASNLSEKARFVVNYPISTITFSRDGSKLLILTSDQNFYVVDTGDAQRAMAENN